MSVVVPFRRELHVGMEGPDVRALQRALRKADVRSIAPTGEFRSVTEQQVIKFQVRMGIRKDRGIVKENTWKRLPFDGYDRYLVTHRHKPPKADAKIDRFCKVAWWYYGNRPLHYLMQRPMADTDPPPNVDTDLDCSEFVYVCAKAAGLPDPSGLGYVNVGNTSTYLGHMKHADGPGKGVLVFYSSPDHVAICVRRDNGTWMVLSHGSEGGPRYLPYNYRVPVAYRRF